jgi:hypothetical protein
MFEIPADEYEQARQTFKWWDTGGNHLFPMKVVGIAAIVTIVLYLLFSKWWILILTALCILDLVKKLGIREGFIYGFEYGMERGFCKGKGMPYPYSSSTRDISAEALPPEP